jgi:tetratricopeptide (TPR) repeat protein
MSFNTKDETTLNSELSERLGAMMTQALQFQEKGDIADAELLYVHILALDPIHIKALQGLSLLLYKTAKFDEAVEHLNRALHVEPDNALLFYDRAIVFQTQGHYKVAVQNYNLTLFLNPYYTNAYVDRGLCFEAEAQPIPALLSYEQALVVDPSFAGAWYNKANLLQTSGDHVLANRCYLIALKINPQFWAAYTNNGLSLFALKKYGQAVLNYNAAAQLSPFTPIIHYNRANALRALGQLGPSEAGYDKAIQLNPQFAAAFANRGLIKKDKNLLDAAIQDYELALSLDANLLEARWNLAIAYLMKGDFKKGWSGYELRFKHSELRESVGARDFAVPQWDGQQALHGKKILVYCEQGLGDAIQFCRYLPLLLGKGAEIIFEVKPALKALFSCFKDSVLIVDKITPDLSFDYFSPLLSLAKSFETTLDTIPPSPVLKVPQNKLDASKKLFNLTNVLNADVASIARKKRIALVWSGNPRHTNDHNRSISLSTLVRYLPPDFEYYAIQKEISETDQALLKTQTRIFNMSEHLSDLTDTAAICMQLDLIISVDTSVAHLSAALGLPTWILLPYCPDWRWLMDKESSPWYPSARLIRQQKLGDWDCALEQLKGDLIHLSLT